ncbi:restriction endonuclease subunit S [Acidithiobacillus sp.]|jgi:type I restriction enzyme S subunit|uniref:restriction endonuclease subunit S n=2 Tax=Acidithiobacillus sp. TaxID=1872118 RepID=UPI0035628405
MEVKPGYKLTEVGVIPEDWEVKRLGEVTECLDNLRVPLNERQREKIQGDLPYCGANGILDYINSFSIDDDIILMAEDGGYFDEYDSRPIAYRMIGRCWVNNHAHILKALPSYNQDFLFWCLVHRNILSYLASGTRAKLNKSEMNKIEMSIPPLPEQAAIATTLSDVDVLISALDVLISKKKQIKQGAMQELLSGKRRLPGFSGEWQVKRLGELGSTYGGLTGKTKSDFGSGKAFYITFMNIMSNVIINSSEFDMVKIGSNEKQNIVLNNDIFFNGSSETPEEVGLCAVLQTKVENVYLNSFCFGYRLHINESADGLFLAYYFRSNVGRELLKSLAQGATRYNLSKRALLMVEFQLPPFPEQQAIATILSDMDAEITALESRRKKTRALKQGMMQELLTGRIRLIHPAAHAVSA